MGWQPVAFSEIEPFPSAVLAHHYPHVSNLGDMTKFKEWNLGSIDLLVGGTPCQSFSVAGLRKGLADPRGNLMLTFLAIAERERPKWIVWENVPGVLSSNGGRDFGTFLAALGELGYGWAYRVLDAQWFGVAQRRRRVFVVGCLGDQAGAAAVLFESESVQRNLAPSREARQGAARGVGGGPADGSISGAVTRKWAKGSGGPAGDECYNMVAQPVATFAKTHKPMSVIDAEGWSPVDAAPTVTHWPRDRSDAGTDVAVVYERHDQDARVKEVSVAPTLHSKSDNTCDLPMVQSAMQVRRLTPVECERLQGFPDNYTNIPWRKKPESPDGPRYKALGNSMAVPVMRWIGERINKLETEQ
jgi:DNA (cytosine-5)-methyltransferase 1